MKQCGIDQPGCGTSRQEACATLDYLLQLESGPDVSTSQVAQSKQIITDKSITASQLTIVRILLLWFYVLFSSASVKVILLNM